MSGLLIFLPISVEDATRRNGLLELTCRTLARSLDFARHALPGPAHVLFHLNGAAGEPLDRSASGIFVPNELAIVRSIASDAFGIGRFTWDPIPGKTRAVNVALDEARSLGCRLLLCVDDDLLIPPTAVAQMLETAAAHPNAHSYTAYKAPLVGAAATPFQRLYSFAFTTSFVHGIYPKRPTGSFYCLNVNKFEDFPDHCNEGDLLACAPHVYSGVVVRSPFPASRDEEVARRVRLELASRAAGRTRLHHDPAYLEYVDKRFRLPAAVDAARYRRALSLSRGIVAEAMARTRVSE